MQLDSGFSHRETSVCASREQHTASPQGCVLSPVLFTLRTYESTTNHSIKYTDDTTVIELSHNNEEDAYREEVKLSSGVLKVEKTKEMVIDFRKKNRHQWT